MYFVFVNFRCARKVNVWKKKAAVQGTITVLPSPRENVLFFGKI